MAGDVRSVTLRVNEELRGDGLQRAAIDARRMADEADRMGTSADHAGAHLRGLDRDAANLNKTIAESRDRVRELHQQIARTGGTDRSLFGDLRREESNLRKLERTALAIAAIHHPGGGGKGGLTVLEGLLPGGAGSGGGGWGGTGIDFSRGLGESRGMLIMGLIGLAIAASPAIGAAVAGAVTGVVGGGGIVGGVVAAATDPRVQDAWSRFTESFSADDFGKQAFVKPTIAALDELKSAFRDMNLGDAMEQMAPFVTVLAKGIGDLGRNLMPGLNDALSKSGPFLEVMAQGLAETGEALGQMLSDMASSHGAIEGLSTLFDLLTGTIRFLGAATETLADIWDELTNIGEYTGDKVEKVARAMQHVGDVMKPLGVGFQVFSFVWKTLGDRAEDVTDHFAKWNDVADQSIDKAEEAKRRYSDLRFASDSLAMSIAGQRDQLNALNAAYENFYNIQMGVDEANQNVNRAWLHLRESLKENGKHWETNTRQGLDNRDAVLGVVSALNQQRDKALAAAGDNVAAQQAVNRTYEQGIADLEKLAKKSGLVGAALQDLVKEYELKFTLKVSIDAASAALLALATKTASAALGLNMGFGAGGTGKSTAKPWQQTGNAWSPWPGNYPPGFASGGWAPANMPVVIGEHSPMGPMLTSFRRPTYIMPGGGGSSGGGGTARVVIDITGGGDHLADWFRDRVRVEGGGDVQLTFGRSGS